MYFFFKKGLSVILILLLFYNVPAFNIISISSNTVEISKDCNAIYCLDNETVKDGFNIILKNLNSVFENGLNTERLIIDKINNLDVDKLSEFIFDQDITKYYFSDCSGKKIIENYKFNNLKFARNNIMFKKVYNNVKYYISKKFKGQDLVADFAIRLKNTKEPCGIIGYSIQNISGKLIVSVHYFLGKKYQKNGYAKEAAINLTKYILKNIPDYTLKIGVHKNNISSQKVAGELIKGILISNNESKYSKSVIDINNMFDYRVQKIA